MSSTQGFGGHAHIGLGRGYSLDEVAYFERALTRDEVVEHFSGNAIDYEAETAALLARFRPWLIYDNEEAYRADSAAAITDWSENGLLRTGGHLG